MCILVTLLSYALWDNANETEAMSATAGKNLWALSVLTAQADSTNKTDERQWKRRSMLGTKVDLLSGINLIWRCSPMIPWMGTNEYSFRPIVPSLLFSHRGSSSRFFRLLQRSFTLFTRWKEMCFRVKIHDIRIVDRPSNRMVARGIADSTKVCNHSELSSYVNVPVDNVYYAWILFCSRLI